MLEEFVVFLFVGCLLFGFVYFSILFEILVEVGDIKLEEFCNLKFDVVGEGMCIVWVIKLVFVFVFFFFGVIGLL